MSKSRSSKRAVQIAAILVLTTVLLWLFFRGSDTRSILSAVSSAQPQWVLAAIAATMVNYFIRAMRWQILLSPLGHAGLWNCFSTTVIGFMVNFLVPTGRVGEVARPYLLARREGLSASGAFATIFLERLLDLVTVTLLIGVALLVGELPTRDGRAVSGLEAGGALGLLTAFTGLAVLYLSARYPETTLRFARPVLGLLPERLTARALAFLDTFVSGLGVLLDARRLSSAMALSLILWLTVSLGFWLGARALGVGFAYPHTFLVIGFLTIGVAAPTPGGIGGYHYMGALALTQLFGTDPSVARAVVLVNHAIAFLPVTFLGIAFFLRAGLSFDRITATTESQDDKEKENP